MAQMGWMWAFCRVCSSIGSFLGRPFAEAAGGGGGGAGWHIGDCTRLGQEKRVGGGVAEWRGETAVFIVFARVDDAGSDVTE